MVFRCAQLRAARSGVTAVARVWSRAFARITALAAILAAGPFGAPAGAQNTPPPPLTGSAILARVKAGLRAHERPPYVVYTLVRHDTLEGIPDPLNSYTLRIWCRTGDGAALSRRVFGSAATGGAEFIMPAFDKPVDPGPPTADLLDVIRETQGYTTPPPQPANGPRVIGTVSVVIETHYHVTYAGRDGDDDHLVLEARHDPDRNRLTDLYVDHTTYALHRAVAHDHLYAEGRKIPERFEIDFGTQDDVPVIVGIHGETDDAGANGGVPFHTETYSFEDITFPAALPDWYFEPAHYGQHRDELPA